MLVVNNCKFCELPLGENSILEEGWRFCNEKCLIFWKKQEVLRKQDRVFDKLIGDELVGGKGDYREIDNSDFEDG